MMYNLKARGWSLPLDLEIWTVEGKNVTYYSYTVEGKKVTDDQL